ncbi:MAG: histone deacetylase [Solirubrobacterales bacterium]|nr:histone deacetylase [Solirubrobacterales bacterium]
MRVWSHADFDFPLPPGHKYPLGKYRLLRAEAIAEGHDVDTPGPISWEALLRVHDPRLVQAMRAGELDRRTERVLGLPWSPQLVERARRGTLGTLHAARDALGGRGVGMMLGGGTHHAGRTSARGYCLFNDLAVVTTELRRERLAQRVLVVDCDVHQGDGTAELLTPDPDAFTLSLQCERNYPFSRIPSDLDVELPAGTGDDGYLAALAGALTIAARRFGVPDLVLYLAGADPWEGDALGRLALTKAGLRTRDVVVLDHARARGVPVVVTLAGGYPPELRDGVEINAATLAETAARVGG